jgi:hypothetical protein
VKLRYTLPALADLNSILDYIAVRSPQGRLPALFPRRHECRQRIAIP